LPLPCPACGSHQGAVIHEVRLALVRAPAWTLSRQRPAWRGGTCISWRRGPQCTRISKARVKPVEVDDADMALVHFEQTPLPESRKGAADALRMYAQVAADFVARHSQV